MIEETPNSTPLWLQKDNTAALREDMLYTMKEHVPRFSVAGDIILDQATSESDGVTLELIYPVMNPYLKGEQSVVITKNLVSGDIYGSRVGLSHDDFSALILRDYVRDEVITPCEVLKTLEPYLRRLTIVPVSSSSKVYDHRPTAIAEISLERTGSDLTAYFYLNLPSKIHVIENIYEYRVIQSDVRLFVRCLHLKMLDHEWMVGFSIGPDETPSTDSEYFNYRFVDMEGVQSILYLHDHDDYRWRIYNQSSNLIPKEHLRSYLHQQMLRMTHGIVRSGLNGAGGRYGGRYIKESGDSEIPELTFGE